MNKNNGGFATKKKVSPWFISFGAALSGYFGYLINPVWKKGITFTEFFEAFNQVCAEPFKNYYTSTTLKAVLIAELVYLIAMIMYVTSQKKYMLGREHGSAQFASVKAVNRILADKEESKNRILSQNIRMSIHTRHTHLNNNVLIIGGSGAGKTFYEVKPNLMQMNTSFIVTDPKGEIVRSCGQFLKNNGYKVKVLNLMDMDLSDCYNPFKYVREETDVIKLITNLISNTTPKGATPSEPFWESATCS